MAQFDGIVIGAGHNGLVCAAYLARAGLKIAVLDCEPEIGGGASTKEFLLPGYQSNMHANFFIGLDDFPIVQDLELNKCGFKWLTPDVQHAALYRDGTAILLHRDSEKSAASISKFSQKDAESYVYLHRRFAVELAPLMRSFLFHPPLPPDEVASRMMDSDEGREIFSFAKMSIFEAIESHFEHPKMRALFFLFSHAITVENAPGTGIFLPSLFSTHTTLGLPVGGAIQLPLALERIVTQNRGVVLRNSLVREVIRENGRAAGVMLDNGEKMFATQFVTSSLNAPASIKLAGEDAFPDEVNEKVRNWDWGFHSLSTLHLALVEPPQYTAANFDPDVGRVYNIIFGADSGEEMAANTEERRNGLIPSQPMGNGSCNSQHDPSYAPPGGHVAFWWPGAPYELKDGPQKWDEIKEEYTDRLVDEWRGYAPNLTPDNVRAAKLYTPLDIERGNKNMVRGGVRMGAYVPEQLGINRPHPLLSCMRTPLEGFYLCSSSCQGGGLNGAPGYNAAGVIAEDLGIEKWWEPLPAPAAPAV